MAKQDLILIHAPSVYDFRKEFLFYGPVSDLVPSTPVFEMYPFGFMTLAAHLHKLGYKVRIVNLASMMLNDPRLDVPEFLRRLDARVFGIDLHWLPHAHGSLAVAEIVRRLHPGSKVLFGGYSSTYYHRELVRYPQVDMVMRGDSTEVPVAELFAALDKDGDLEKVQNLTWKDERGVHENPFTFVPEDIDYIEIDYGWIIRSVIRHRDLEGHKPFKDWDRYPLTVAFTVRGCQQQCLVCGGCSSAMKGFLGRARPAFRSPELVAQDIRSIQDYLKAPTFVVGDVRAGGKRYAERFFSEAKRLGIDNPVVLELFVPAEAQYYRDARTAFPSYSIEFSPDSHDEQVRHALGRRFDTSSMERTVQLALQNDCRRFDLFFMIGLPQQTRECALDSAKYAKRLHEITSSDKRLFVFESPLAPFLDPGSYAFEHAEEVGYKLLARTLEEHRSRLASPSWKYVLSFETKWMSRDEIVDASYDAADLLSRARFESGLFDQDELGARLERTDMAREMMREIDSAMAIKDPSDRSARFEELREKGRELMESTICQKSDLEWESHGILKSVPRAVFSLVRGKGKRKG
ncbi:MAG: TIGR04190 family B12-binding domain/radical SAM domain protein [Methanomassiliicoccales archaeon]|jgi:B12-binding domain/radical SAM domain protein|nr:TIGR04190 family B12-binding domain/radical SAM domain protein [Methanomassiliicoccales archaeon]MDD1756359.1 TIGR04190 family B12-binding domain/radical SAM domain protein [Methanomassiliicoccales archaeon]